MLIYALPANPLVWHPHFEVWLVMAGLLGAYLWAVRVWGPRYTSPGEQVVTKSQTRLFALGVAALWIGAEWPIHDLAEGYLFSVHMVQHFIFSLVAAPLLLMGLPGWMARKLLSPKPVMAVMKRLTRPFPAMLAFNGFLVLSHAPAYMNAVLNNHALHFGSHAVLLGLSLLMWWPVLSPLPELPRLAAPAQMLYLFGQTILPTVPASFLTFASRPFYSFYVHAPRVFSGWDALADQSLGGVFMKLGGGLLLWSVITVLFFRWSVREEEGVPDPAEWQHLERELNKVGK